MAGKEFSDRSAVSGKVSQELTRLHVFGRRFDLRAHRLHSRRQGHDYATADLTMPAEDISHPLPDLTGYITEGQVVLETRATTRVWSPPIKVLPSLSRLMDKGIGQDYAHDDDPALAG